MYYYAYINTDNGFCYDVSESEVPMDDPSYIEVTGLSSYAEYQKYYSIRKIYENGVWRDATVEEAEEMYATTMGERVTIGNEWLNIVLDNKAPLSHVHDGYATSDHLHTEYASFDDLQELEDVVDSKADSNHIHTEYAPMSHSHADYATQTSVDALNDEIDGKADAQHSHAEYALSSHEHNYAEVGHNHDSVYAPLSHSHTDYVTTTDFDALEIEVDGKANTNHNHSNYSEITHNHDLDYSDISHDHDDDYATLNHSHNDYATVASVNTLSTTVSGKANASHDHDDRYYTETEIDDKLAAKADSSHNHTGTYDANGAAASALTSANAYTDSKIDALVGEGASTTLDTIGEISAAIEDNQDMIDTLNAAIGNKANASDLTSHTGNTTVHITDAERNTWNAKSDFSGNYNDLTNKPTIPSINGLATETYVDEAVSGITVESIGALPDTTVIPTIPTNISSFVNDAGYLTEHQSLDGLASITYVDAQIDAIDIPFDLSDLVEDSAHRTVTDAEKATWNAKSNFSGSYNDLTNKPTIPSITGLATETYVDEAVSEKANSSHTHDDRYYTETEINTKLSAKSDSTHNHNSSYDALGSADTALDSAKEYTDDAIADEVTARDSAIATAKSSAISTAASDATTKANNALASAKSYADTVGENVKNDLLGNAGSAYDTLKELGDLIDENVDAIEALEAVAAGKANASHTHTIANITNLQSTLDGKAAASHGTHVSYSTTVPVMDGTASVGTATTVARSDHKHPTDTSRASKTEVDTHTSNKSNPHSVTLAQLGLTATAVELNVLDGITTTVTELNYVDGVTSNIQTQLNGKLSTTGKAVSAATADSATNVAWSGVTSKPSYYDAKAIKSITRNGTTFTYTCMDGTTGTFTQQDNNTTYSAVTTSANGLMIASDKVKLDGMVFATVSEVETYLAI